MSKALQQKLTARFGARILAATSQHGDEAVVVAPADWREVHLFLRDDPSSQMQMLIDLCGVDYPDREPRFEVVTHLYSLTKKHRLRVKTAVGDADGDDAVVDSLLSVWRSADWMEREAFDMFGVRFAGHPDLRRILTYPEFEGHPLRKDYPAARTQPLVPYREGAGVQGKLAPFGADEGMPFGRQTHGAPGSPEVN
ncbi:MAG: NADH-quinone oxidoreductase subunit C [Polyangiaceae bacterium]|nr:NADH-quinone oxidoreductase subunit C [Polyangiaceae bacterium]